MKKKIIYALVAICIGAGTWGAFEASNSYAQQTQTKVQPTTTQQTKAPQTQVQSCIEVTPLEIVANPHEYLNKNIKMNATFDKFSTLGLDYQPALKKSEDYIGILIQRDDVVGHNIPLSEMKLFLKKDLAEKHIDLDTGDKVEIVAKVFSTALNDPWLDVYSINVIKKANNEENKK